MSLIIFKKRKTIFCADHIISSWNLHVIVQTDASWCSHPFWISVCAFFYYFIQYSHSKHFSILSPEQHSMETRFNDIATKNECCIKNYRGLDLDFCCSSLVSLLLQNSLLPYHDRTSLIYLKAICEVFLTQNSWNPCNFLVDKSIRNIPCYYIFLQPSSWHGAPRTLINS